MTARQTDNQDIAELLDRIADLLDAQDADSYRIRAYRSGARNLRELDRSVRETDREFGRHGLERIPGIGESLAGVIQEYLHTGRSSLADRLEGEVSPEDRIALVPGIGEKLAREICAELGVETLEDLEMAAHDGRLESLRGFGRRRVAGVRDALAGMLSRSSRRSARERRWREREGADTRAEKPSVAILLAVDAQYREKAERGSLPTIAPRRFNPGRERWLPIMHAERDGWRFTAMFSNTARAHQSGATRDWVVIFFERSGEEDQCTVVTEPDGPLSGRRVIRGREHECAEYYRLSARESSVRMTN